jgi:hypothetical protein
MACPRSNQCVFHLTVEPSIIKRVRYASLFPYCRGSQHESCALYAAMQAGRDVQPNLMPDGSVGDYLEDATSCAVRRFLIIEDSPVFAALASSCITSNFKGAQVVRKPSYHDALEDLNRDYAAIVCGFGLGGGKTAHDVRMHTNAPMVVLTGHLGELDLPRGARRVGKSEGPEALAAALRACMA